MASKKEEGRAQEELRVVFLRYSALKWAPVRFSLEALNGPLFFFSGLPMQKAFIGDKKELSVPARLAAGACAGMTSTFVSPPPNSPRTLSPPSHLFSVV